MSSYSLDHIFTAGGYPYTSGSALCLPKIFQMLLSAQDKVLEAFGHSGTLTKTLPEFLAAIEARGGRCLVRKVHTGDWVYTWEHSYLDLDYNKKSNAISISGYCTDPELIPFFKDLEDNFMSKDKKNMVFSIVKDSSGNLTIKNLGNGSSPLVTENYNPEVMEDYQYLIDGFKKSPPIGRIGILAGEPGTGKTHLIRSLLSQFDSVFLIVPSNLVDSLDRPEFMPLLLRVRDDYEKPIIIIIEDGDLCLVPRKSDNMSTIASLLNLSDGILGSIIDIKLVISSNAGIRDMDSAILRPGRLCKQIYVGPLNYEQANKVYRRLMADENANLPKAKEYTLAEVYSFFNNKDFSHAPPAIVRRAIGFSATPANAILNKVEK